jgi:hypothetical protein
LKEISISSRPLSFRGIATRPITNIRTGRLPKLPIIFIINILLQSVIQNGVILVDGRPWFPRSLVFALISNVVLELMSAARGSVVFSAKRVIRSIGSKILVCATPGVLVDCDTDPWILLRAGTMTNRYFVRPRLVWVVGVDLLWICFSGAHPRSALAFVDCGSTIVAGVGDVAALKRAGTFRIALVAILYVIVTLSLYVAGVT